MGGVQGIGGFTPLAGPTARPSAAPASPTESRPLNLGLAGTEARFQFQQRLGEGAPMPYAVQALYGSALPLIPFPGASDLPGRVPGLLVLGASTYQASAGPPGGAAARAPSPSAPGVDQYA